jgi:hypothetical protein
MALEHYARQARNTQGEFQAYEIRLRAERRCGQLTKELITAQGQRSDLTSVQRASKLDALEQAEAIRQAPGTSTTRTSAALARRAMSAVPLPPGNASTRSGRPWSSIS